MSDDFAAEILIVGQYGVHELLDLNNILNHRGYQSTITQNPGGHRWRKPGCRHRLALVHWPMFKNSRHTVPAICAAFPGAHHVALFDCERHRQLQLDAVRAGLDGMFFEGESAPALIRGINNILDGGLWFKRTILEQVIIDQRQSKKADTTPPGDGERERITDESNDLELLDSLTRRERAVFELLTLGARNKEIANELNISAHTVKAHVYSIFKKTKSRNRVEVINWANQYQRDLLRSVPG